MIVPKEVRTAYEKLQAALAELDISVILDEQREAQKEGVILVTPSVF